MPTQSTFTDLKKITVKPVAVRLHPDPDHGMYSTQTVVFHFGDGSQHEIRLHLNAGLNALAIGELVTNQEVTA
ncbi:hypothetical protein [Collimonas pratensis]|uniref:Uncharacterized protein n=1 Tax=Collimonas pratensis TaxID=279113 RepID=A0A127Q7D6_9BURK|nr:hypothetical protein [Collimonas pratensis]AMP05978.1 hypothetical protein CPter91_3657 [Collimonas pratensis]